SSEHEIARAEVSLLNWSEALALVRGCPILLRGQDAAQSFGCDLNFRDLRRGKQEHLAHQKLPALAVKGQSMAHLAEQWLFSSQVIPLGKSLSGRRYRSTQRMAGIEAAGLPACCQRRADSPLEKHGIDEHVVHSHF